MILLPCFARYAYRARQASSSSIGSCPQPPVSVSLAFLDSLHSLRIWAAFTTRARRPLPGRLASVPVTLCLHHWDAACIRVLAGRYSGLAECILVDSH
jgi:hypothetical protein